MEINKYINSHCLLLMDIRHVTLLHTLRIFEDKKHLCSSQLHFKHYCTIHFPCTLNPQYCYYFFLIFTFIYLFIWAEVGIESWSGGKSHLYFQRVLGPSAFYPAAEEEEIFLHRQIWLTCHTSRSHPG